MSSSNKSSPSTTNAAATQATRWVVYRQFGDAFVFASVELAVHLHAVYVALNESSTWGEFRRLLPAQEWPDIEQRLFLGEDEVEDEDRSHWEDDDAPFRVDRVRGIDETDYPLDVPIWLGDADAFPRVLITAHNDTLAATASGSIHWLIPVECGEQVAATLREWGYIVERTDFLDFC